MIRKCTRIARLRGDWENLWWLELEVLPLQYKEQSKKRLAEEIFREVPRERAVAWSERIPKHFVEERTVTALGDGPVDVKKGQEAVLGQSVPETENFIENIAGTIGQMSVPPGLTPIDTYFVNEEVMTQKLKFGFSLAQRKEVLDRVRHRVHEFLSVTEKQLVLGAVSSDILERNRQYVDRRLVEIAPDVATQFGAAYRRLQSDDGPEAWSHALTSCRRALKSLADRLYPASDVPVSCADGKVRMLNDERFINRLLQYAHEKTAGRRARQLMIVAVEDLGTPRSCEFAEGAGFIAGVHGLLPRVAASRGIPTLSNYLFTDDEAAAF